MIDQALQFIAAALPLALVGLGLAFAAVAYDQSSKGKTPLLQTGLATLAFALSLFSCGAFVPQAQAAPADHQATAEASAHQVAQDSDLQGKGALGNLEASSDGVQFFLGNDLLWAGSACSFDKVQAPNDLLAAGQSIEVDNATVKGSVRAAGQNVVVKGTQVKQSVTLAGQLVQVAKGSSEAVALCGQTAAFSGETKALHAAAGTVIINGIVHGDVNVTAQKLEIGPGAVIDGTLTAEVGTEPAIADGASIGKKKVTLNPETSNVEAELGQAAGVLSAVALGGMIFAKALGLLGFLLIALLAEWLVRRQVQDSAQMARTRTAALVGSGVVGGLVAPILLVALLFTVVGVPLAFGLGGALLAIQMLAGGFAAASLAKIAFPKMGRFAGSLLMALILGLVSLIPVVGWILTVAAFMYLLGYVLQKIYLGMRSDRGSAPKPYDSAGPGVPQDNGSAPAAAPQAASPAAPFAPEGAQVNPVAAAAVAAVPAAELAAAAEPAAEPEPGSDQPRA